LIDITGFPKGGQIFRRVMAGASPIEINVSEPLPEGQQYARKGWSWPTEYPYWGWDAFEGKTLDVKVMTYAPEVRLTLNGKVIGTEKRKANQLQCSFEVPYENGILMAEGLENGKVVCSTKLESPGKPAKLRLVADRNPITTNNNDLSYVSIEVVDAQGRLVMDGRHSIHLSIEGEGSLYGCGNGYHKDVYSFRNPEKMTTWRGRAMAIIRPSGKPGTVKVHVMSDELGTAELDIVSK